METTTKYPAGIETPEEYAEYQLTGVLPKAAMERVYEIRLAQLRKFNEERANRDPMSDPTNWDKVALL